MAEERKYRRRSVSLRPHIYERAAKGSEAHRETDSISAFVELAIDELCDRLGVAKFSVSEALDRQAKRSPNRPRKPDDEGIGGYFTF